MTQPVIALDVPSFAAATALVERLGEQADFYKVGLELYAADGPRVVSWLRERGKRVFVDLKAYDIPNTVRGVARSVAATGASLLTVHAAGGPAMIAAAVEGAGGSPEDGGCGILAVTVLTSFDAASYAAATGRQVAIADEVLRLARLAEGAGAHGVVCSGQEIGAVRSAAPRLRVLVPGVRPAGSAVHDQARVITPSGAATAGASYIVLGRAVTAAPDPAMALSDIIRELTERTLPQAP